MKFFKLMAIAFLAMLGFVACDSKTEHIYDDHSADLVGTWTCLTENYAETLIINADGTAVSYGVEDGEYWENVKGTVTVNENNIVMKFEDDDDFTGHFDIIPGMAFSLFEDSGERFTYQYCANDLSDEIVGMWVCNDGLTDSITIMSYSDNGKTTMTTAVALGTSDPLVKHESDYVVAGNLVFMELPAANEEGKPMYTAALMTYIPDATSTGDIITHKKYVPFGGALKESVMSFLRIKQSLELEEKTYDYSSAYVSNAKGIDEDFTILGNTFNMANITAGNFDMMFRSELFCVEFPNDKTIKQLFRANGKDVEIEIPITVDGNKVTLDLSNEIPACRKVDMYMFQDQDNSQLHIYMPTSSFINYFANMELYTLIEQDTIDPTDADAVAKIFADMESRVDSINVSFVMKARR